MRGCSIDSRIGRDDGHGGVSEGDAGHPHEWRCHACECASLGGQAVEPSAAKLAHRECKHIGSTSCPVRDEADDMA